MQTKIIGFGYKSGQKEKVDAVQNLSQVGQKQRVCDPCGQNTIAQLCGATGVSHPTLLLGAPMTLPVCSFHARLVPPFMWDQMLPQAYHKIICFSHMRATTHEEPMPVPSV